MEFMQTILEFITKGGSVAVIAILFAAVVALLFDRQKMNTTLEKTTQRVYDAKDSETHSVKDIIDRYHQGNLDLVTALNEIKIVLVTIQNTRR